MRRPASTQRAPQYLERVKNALDDLCNHSGLVAAGLQLPHRREPHPLVAGGRRDSSDLQPDNRSTRRLVTKIPFRYLPIISRSWRTIEMKVKTEPVIVRPPAFTCARVVIPRGAPQSLLSFSRMCHPEAERAWGPRHVGWRSREEPKDLLSFAHSIHNSSSRTEHQLKPNDVSS